MAERGKKRGAVTLKDMALETGFSVNTVSRALADKPDISEETKTVIREKAAQMGYIANAMASFLRSGVSKIISFIVGDISNPHFSVMIKEMQTALQRKGYTVIIFNTEEKPVLERQAITTSISQNVDGIIICPTPGGQENIQYIQQHGKPFVIIGRRFSQIDASYVVCNDQQGGYIATQHLLKMGHRDILFLNGPRGISSTVERMYGYQCALSEAALPYRSTLVRTVPIMAGNSTEKMAQILERTDRYTAVLGFSDLVAWQAVCILERMGRSVPADCSVIGFDNIRQDYPMRLTSISSSKTTMAKRAVDILLRELEDSAAPKEYLVLETHLIDGDTVKPR